MRWLKLIYGQDGERVSSFVENQFSFSDGDIKYVKRERKKVFDFVGFITSNNETLAVFPKHYFSLEEIEELNSTPSPDIYDANLLFKAISTYMREDTLRTATAEKYIGEQKEYESDYPFNAFFEVYDYYRKYGLYYEEETIVTRGQRGKISWKDTIRHSNILISGGNIVFTPLYSKVKNRKSDFISDCMVFVINHTLKTFPFFLSMKSITGKNSKFDFIANKEYVLKQLYRIQNSVFKDIHRKLVSSLIKFFEELQQKKHGGDVYVKISFFDKIWQRMIEKYLNDYFAGVDAESGGILFDENQETSAVRFAESTFSIDDSHNSFKIRPDHYGKEEGKQYIFDSKYYYELSEMNYKQFTYDVLLQALNSEDKTYNVLILPGEPHNSSHLLLKPEFRNRAMNNHRIVEQYISVKKVMEHYVAQ